MTIENSSQEIEKLLKKIRDAITDGEYIFRGEPEIYSKAENGNPEENKISSNLYREFEKAMKAENFNIKVVQDEILKNVKEHTKETDEDAILEQLQHFGGKTNQIDFTTDYLTALFFACDGAHNDDGRLIFLDKRKFKEQIHNPRKPQNRVIAQKSVFVRPSTGIVEPDKKITIDMDLKKSILSYLEKHHDISTKTIYNDIHGYITRHKSHESGYTNFYLGLIYQDEEKYELAIKHYTKALGYDSASFNAYNNRGNLYDIIGEYDKAIADFNKAIELNPNYADIYSNLGNTYGNKDDIDKAISNANKAIELNPNFPEPYNIRSTAYRQKGDFDKAISNANKAIELNPNDAKAYNNCATAYANKGNYDEAITNYDKIIELNPNDAEAYCNRGVAYAKRIEYDKAIADYNKAIELNPNLANAYANRGNIQRSLGNNKAAEQDFQTALKLAEQQGKKLLAAQFQQEIAHIQILIAALPADPD